MNKSVNIICMKWGDKFPALYVNRLYSMVLKNTTIPFRFICFTDNSTDIHPDVEIQALPELHIPNGLPERGWRKLTVFAENFGNLSGTTLFLDLDIVIVDSIDEFFTYPGDFLIAHDKHRPARLEGNSSVFRFEIGQHPEILSYFIENFSQIRQEVRHEQAYLSREIKKTARLTFWPDKWVPSFKYAALLRGLSIGFKPLASLMTLKSFYFMGSRDDKRNEWKVVSTY